MTTATNPTRKIPGSSRFWFRTNGINSVGTFGLVDDDTGAFLDNTTATAFVTIKVHSSGATVLNQQALTYVSPGYWKYQAAATICAASAGPWDAIVEVHGPAGIGDTMQREFYYTLVENNALT